MLTQEERNLLIKDLCGRLPYGVKIKEEYGDYINVNIHNAHIEHLIDRVVSGLDKLVLRPLSTMTEEEHEEYRKYVKSVNGFTYYINCSDLMDWYNRKMFDYRGLIPMGLALEAPEGMYNN